MVDFLRGRSNMDFAGLLKSGLFAGLLKSGLFAGSLKSGLFARPLKSGFCRVFFFCGAVKTWILQGR